MENANIFLITSRELPLATGDNQAFVYIKMQG